MPRAARIVLTAAAAVGIAAAGVGAGAGLYASLGESATTTTVVSVERGQPVSAPQPQPEPQTSVGEVYEQTIRGVVDLRVTSSDGSGSLGGGQQAAGSGFVYDRRGHIVTNEHVVSGGDSVRVKFWNGRTYNATVVATDRSTDVAVIKVDAPASLLHPIALADSSRVKIGDEVVAIGSPFGLEGTVTSGIVSALDRKMESPSNYTIGNAIQTDAPINHGNSGGPLIDMTGHVIGVNTQIKSDSGGNDGIGFAIPSNTIRTIAAQMVAGKAVQHAFVGVSVTDSTSPPGALLSTVVPGGPADSAGLQSGDVITKLGGTAILSSEDISGVIDSHEPGDKLKVTYSRGGDTRTVTVTLGTRPS